MANSEEGDGRFRLGLLLNPDLTEKLLGLCQLSNLSPYDFLRVTIQRFWQGSVTGEENDKEGQ